MYVPAAHDVQLVFPITFLYLPGTHKEHGPPFGPVAPALQVHAVTTELPKTELELSAHATQTSDAFAPTIPEYVPALQLVQAAVPFTVLYFPVAHNEHGPPFGPVAPTLHTQAAITTLPVPETAFAEQFRHVPAPVAPTVPEYVFAGQLVHTLELVAPIAIEYVPAGHAVHAAKELAPTVLEYAPAGHKTHALSLLAPGTSEYAPAEQLVHTLELVAPIAIEYAPAGQLMHTVEAVAPTVLEYAPAGHKTHAVAPCTFEYAPAGQSTHVLTSGTKYLPTEQPTHEAVMHPLTCTSVKYKTRPVPYIEMWRYRPRSGLTHVTCAM